MTPPLALQLHTPTQAVRWLSSRVSGTLRSDSRKVQAGDGFIAWPGAATDGRRHVRAALAQGAAACLVEHEGVDAFGFDVPTVATYAQLKKATGPIAAAWFGDPSRSLDVVAFTGTNGKTSSAWWLAQSLSGLESGGIPCGLIGTLGIGVPSRAGSAGRALESMESNGLTTPDPVMLQMHLRQFVDQGLKACAIEASSIGIMEARLSGTHIRVAVFTNLTQDHLDYHKTMTAYWDAKRSLFSWPGLRAAVVNLDDPRGRELARTLRSQALDLWTIGVESPDARLRVEGLLHGAEGLHCILIEGSERFPLETRLIGSYNISNLLGVVAAMRALGVPFATAARACERLFAVPGRMEQIGRTGEPMAVVDYAHTPDALEKALTALRPLTLARGGALWCVFGCGGDRDTAKRPLMASAAEQNADRVVVTSDNPRGESPEAIIEQIVRGLAAPAQAVVQTDRATAIRQTLAQCADADVVLIAGKGHEDYQDVAGTRLPFSDSQHVREALAARRGAQ